MILLYNCPFVAAASKAALGRPAQTGISTPATWRLSTRNNSMGGTWSRCRGERHGCRRRRRSWQRTGSRASAWIRFAEQPAPPPVPVRAGGLRRRPAVQVGHAAGGAAHLALVEAPRPLQAPLRRRSDPIPPRPADGKKPRSRILAHCTCVRATARRSPTSRSCGSISSATTRLCNCRTRHSKSSPAMRRRGCIGGARSDIWAKRDEPARVSNEHSPASPTIRTRRRSGQR